MKLTSGENRGTTPADFWDDVRTRNVEESIGDDSVASSVSLLHSAGGMFPWEYAEAKAVLDIGPGRGRLLLAAPAPVKYAVEISRVNRFTLMRAGILAMLPEPVIPTVRIDLAWSILGPAIGAVPVRGYVIRLVSKEEA